MKQSRSHVTRVPSWLYIHSAPLTAHPDPRTPSEVEPSGIFTQGGSDFDPDPGVELDQQLSISTSIMSKVSHLQKKYEILMGRLS